ncbi:MAG: 50S ribosomal protein L10 [Nitrospinae bacterium RIFCSPLOWO2_12_FULL_45_22]|nr:MAG: 50S ribosomal protein L10 [Nitrospinae bacterium RIFCSPLOWO2_12_FULL_45_22]
MVDKGKIDTVEALQDKFNQTKAAVLIDFKGLNVQKINDLRKQLRGAAIEYMVVKNTLARIASRGTQFETITPLFRGPTSIAFSYQDALIPAKILSALTQKEPNLVIKGGILEGKALDPIEVKLLAELPPEEILLSQMLRSLKAPLANFVQILHALIVNLLGVLNALGEKKGQESRETT